MSDMTELLAYWITEREAMRVRKEVETAPYFNGYGYSTDPHMGLVRYCNVRREDDKVTRWLAQHWRPMYNSAWELVLARMVNYIPTLEELVEVLGFGHARPLDACANTMKNRREYRQKVWTSAYTISTCGQSMDKIDYVMRVVSEVRERGAWMLKDMSFASLDSAHKWLMQVDGLGSFLAAQVVADMKNTQGHPLQSAPDWHTWSAPCPGSLKGLTAYYGKPITASQYQRHIEQCWAEVKPLLPANLQDLHMQDFQNCLCEFSKFIRVRRGGHVRNKYPSRTA